MKQQNATLREFKDQVSAEKAHIVFLETLGSELESQFTTRQKCVDEHIHEIVLGNPFEVILYFSAKDSLGVSFTYRVRIFYESKEDETARLLRQYGNTTTRKELRALLLEARLAEVWDKYCVSTSYLDGKFFSSMTEAVEYAVSAGIQAKKENDLCLTT